MKKRICAVIMCLLLAVNLVGVPKAKAVVSEGALLGSIFGSLLVSLGYTWAADNFDAPSFGEAIYDLIKQCDEEMDTGIQLLIDSNLTGLVAAGPGKLQLNYQWVSLARSFAEWFSDKFALVNNSSAVIFSGSGPSITTIDGVNITLTTLSDYSSSSVVNLSPVSLGSNLFDVFGIDTSASGIISSFRLTDNVSLKFDSSNGFNVFYTPGEATIFSSKFSYVSNGYVYPVLIAMPDGKLGYGSYFTSSHPNSSVRGLVSYSSSFQVAPSLLSLTDMGLVESSSLSVEKPQEVHYPDVAEDGSQIYEVTYQGVTATDIEGIIQGAVDQILAGTAAIAGEVVQAQDVPVEPEAPAASEYAVSGLETIFPFCIPFDIYAFCSALNADPVAPSFEWRMQYAPLDLDYTFEIDLSAFDGVAQVLRTMELLAFCVGLAFWTRHLIRG